MTNPDYQTRLSEPFGPEDLKWKPQAVKENRCLAIAYVTARAIMDRLDEVLTPAGWQDEYQALADGAVLCRLSLKLGDEWIVKCDVGGPSEQPDDGDRMKAAFSDALKRAAVKFGIGRYLYRLPHSWVDYDAQRRQIKTPPQLPAWALPRAKPAPAGPAGDAEYRKEAEKPKATAASAPHGVAPSIKITPEQLRLLMEFRDHFGWVEEEIRSRLQTSYGVARFEDLDRAQAKLLVSGLILKYGSREAWEIDAAAERQAIQQEGARP